MLRTFDDHAPFIAKTAFVDETALVIGEVIIGEDSSIWPMAVVRGDIHRIVIGARSNIQDATVIHVTHAGPFNKDGFATLIGNDVVVGHRAVLHGCYIGNNCLIGMGAIIMDGAVIHSDVMVAAGSIVPPNKELESGYLWVGSPVKKIRALTAQELQFMRYSADYYVKLKQKYLANHW